jgi:hypothetical protein
MTNLNLAFSPLLPWPVLAALATGAVLVIALAVWAGRRGAWLRALGLALILFALADPSLVREDRQPLKDVVAVVVDRSASQSIAGRPEQTALSHLRPVKPGRHQHVPLKHVPRPLASLQPEGHESTAADAASQRPPCQPLSQRHCPSERHTPWPEHWRPLAPTPHVRRSHRSPVYDGAQ